MALGLHIDAVKAQHVFIDHAVHPAIPASPQLRGGIAVIRVGAATEAETKYLKLKIEDAANATKAAIAEAGRKALRAGR